MTETIFAGKMPILALRGLCVFPEQTVHFEVGRSKSVKALEAAMQGDQTLLLIPQKDLLVDDPALKDLYGVGCIAKVKQVLKTQGENLRILVTGISRGKITELSQSEPYLSGIVESASVEEPADTIRARALRREANSLYGVYLELCEHPAQTVQLRMLASESSGFIADSIAQNSGIDFPDKAKMLCQLNSVRRLETAVQLLRREVEMLRLEGDIQEKTRAAIDQNQKDYFLREQMKAIREELGEEDDEDEFDTYAQSIQNLHLEAETEKKLLKDVERLKKQPFGSSEGAVLRNYLDTVLELPWNDVTKDNLDLNCAREQLDRDHFGLDEVKERILEHLAVIKLKGDLKSPILCLYGPPGVGKTSLGKSVAAALDRKFGRISLGGLHDESEIRGHRRTYIGAMPGRIIQTIKRCGSSNPVIILDEVDKVTVSNHGDPSSALLEVLDPEQNTTFHDNYIDMEYDLSKVLFIATANNIANIAPALRDRMEMINIPGYLVEEKVRIALDHLLPKQREAHGIKEQEMTMSAETVEGIVSGYTREAGVRSLDKNLAKIARARAKQIAFDEAFTPEITAKDVEKILGMPKFLREEYEVGGMTGVVTGLAWTEVGGDILYIESVLTPGKGKVSLTGNLGEVMKESATIAHEWVMAHHKELGIDPAMFEQNDINIHVPEGAIPKDGPSAGITMVTSIVSTYTGRKVKERIAMTGETTLRGRVMPVGGVKEKILAAKRAGITELILSEENRKDIAEIKEDYIAGLTFHYVKTNDEVLKLALE